MSQPAARVGDLHICPMFTLVVPHVGGPILPPGAPTVLVGGMPAARVGDLALCVGPPDTISRGAFPVLFAGQPAARLGDQTAHGGLISAGCPTVLIGGAGTSGGAVTGGQICAAMAAGRNPPPGTVYPPGHPQAGNPIPANTAGQSYNNCGVESSRQIISQATGVTPTQEGLLNQAVTNGWAEGAPSLFDSGGTWPDTVSDLLAANGVPTSEVSGSMANLERSVAQGRGVIASVMAGTYWPAWAGVPPGEGRHRVLVTGIEYDDSGNPVNIIINDTGIGQCQMRVPAATFEQAMADHGGDLNVTDSPIWW